MIRSPLLRDINVLTLGGSSDNTQIAFKDLTPIVIFLGAFLEFFERSRGFL